MNKLKIFLLLIIGFLLTPITIHAQIPNIKSYKATITNISEEPREMFGQLQKTLVYTVELDRKEEPKVIEIFEQGATSLRYSVYEKGDKVIVEATSYENNINYLIRDFDRTGSLTILFAVFAILVLLIGKKQGLFSLFALGFSYLVIFFVVLKPILGGTDPLLAAILAALIIIPINFYLAHGFKAKTTYAAVSTFITLVIIGLMALWFVEKAKLTGLTSDEAGFIMAYTNGAVNIKELLLAGIIIGALGILDDITISQSSIAHQLKHSKPSIEFKELFQRTLTVGRDHIASLVNTLILVYTSTSLPLLLLFLNNEKGFYFTINSEIVAEEIIIMLITSIGLIIAVPISTFISCYFVNRKDIKKIILDEHPVHAH